MGLDTAAPHSSAFERLKRMIVRGGLSPGTRLTEEAVAERLGVSRTPAREVLRELHAAGLLVARAGRRTELIVAPLTRDDLIEIYQTMGALEGIAAARAASRSATERRRLAEKLDAAERLLEEAALEQPADPARLFERHDTFHRTLVAAGAGARLRQVLDVLRPQTDRYEWMYGPLVGPDHGATFAEHAAIIAAVRRGSAAAAESAVRANWLNGAERLAAALDSWGERGV